VFFLIVFAGLFNRFFTCLKISYRDNFTEAIILFKYTIRNADICLGFIGH